MLGSLMILINYFSFIIGLWGPVVSIHSILELIDLCKF
jgi:hypothetical protein